MGKRTLKIGEVANSTGLTVRTLHHYDQIGLFKPSEVTGSGHRLYTDDDIAKLQQIISLKQLGFALDEIKEIIGSADYDPKEMLNLQLSRLDEQISQLTELRTRLQDISALMNAGQSVSSERFLMAIQMMKMMASPHFSEKHKVEMVNKYKAMDNNGQWETQHSDGRQLLADLRKLMDMGKLPSDLEVSVLAKRWIHMVESFVSEEVVRSAERYYSDNPSESNAYGMDSELYAYIQQAVSCLPT